MRETRVVALADGRDLAWTEYGSSTGRPVLAFHGSPGTRLFFSAHHDAALARDVRLIAPDRPGYGHSTYHRRRSFKTWSDDIEQLADHLGVDRFAVIGVSSGGPNAAACAAFLAGRVVAGAVVSSPVPPACPTTANDSTGKRLMRRLSLTAPSLVGVAFQIALRQASRDPDKALKAVARSLPPVDADIVVRPEIHEAMRADLARPVASTAGRAAMQDLRLERTPWGFELRDVDVPIAVWHGEFDDNVPVESAAWSATQFPRSQFHRVPGTGHLLIHDRTADILSSVAD